MARSYPHLNYFTASTIIFHAAGNILRKFRIMKREVPSHKPPGYAAVTLSKFMKELQQY